MPQSYTCLHDHFVFTTRHRLPTIIPDIRTRLWEYLGGIIKGAGGVPIQIGGTADHVHLLVTLRQEPAIASFMRDLKAASSGWIHDTFPDAADFRWQTGYGAFTVSHSAFEDVKRYIANQKSLSRGSARKASLHRLATIGRRIRGEDRSTFVI